MAITFISLNLWEGGLLMDELLDFLEREQPDILVAQEAYDCEDASAPARFHSVETIQQRLHFKACEFAPALIDIRNGHRFLNGNAVFSRFPIVGHNVIPFDVPFGERTKHDEDANRNQTPRNLQHVVVQADDTQFNVFNFQGVWDLDGDNPSPRRHQMCQTIADAVSGKQHVLLAGDSNLKPTNPALQPVDELLTSVFGHELTTSFNVKRKDMVKYPGYGTAVVDLMYVGHDVRVIKHDCPQVDISDHLPLVAVVEPRGSTK